MVQGGTTYSSSSYSVSSRTPEARKAGIEALKKYDSLKEDNKKDDKSKYGAWGPIYKNKDYFTGLHIC